MVYPTMKQFVRDLGTAIKIRVDKAQVKVVNRIKNGKPAKKDPLSGFNRSFTDALGPARLSYSWILSENDINDELIRYLDVIRNKAQSLEISSDYVKRFLGLAESNVVGSEGFRLQVKARKPDGTVDKPDSDLAEKLWKEYSKKKVVSVDGRMNLRQIETIILRGLLRDGEVFIRKAVRKKDRRFPLKLQFIPPEYVDSQFNRDPGEGQNEVIMGIEIDSDGAPAAYHTLRYETSPGYSRERDRIPASEVIHIFIPTRSEQVRGYSALVSALFKLKMIDGIEEASVTNFRVSASKMGFFTRTGEGVEYIGPEGKDAEGNSITQVVPGQFETLPIGVDFKEFDPVFPEKQFDSFLKSVLRSIASGWGVSYNGLANDYGEVNYSSARVAQLEEREVWKKLQQELVDQFLDPLYEEWLSYAILTQTLPVPEARFEKFNEKKFVGRTWTWVDPKKEIEANVTAVDNGFNSRTRICAEQGLDFEEIVEELSHEEKLANSLGIKFGKISPSKPDTTPDPDADDLGADGSQNKGTTSE